jgi:Ca2+-binding EF-hand superfamily protein
MSKPVSRITFDKYDTDRDGNISKDQFNGLAYNLGKYLSSEALDAAWLKLDLNGDGSLSYEEFLSI